MQFLDERIKITYEYIYNICVSTCIIETNRIANAIENCARGGGGKELVKKLKLRAKSTEHNSIKQQQH